MSNKSQNLAELSLCAPDEINCDDAYQFSEKGTQTDDLDNKLYNSPKEFDIDTLDSSSHKEIDLNKTCNSNNELELNSSNKWLTCAVM